MPDLVKFTWEVSFEQKRNGMLHHVLLDAFTDATAELANAFAEKHGLKPVQGRMTASRGPLVKKGRRK